MITPARVMLTGRCKDCEHWRPDGAAGRRGTVAMVRLAKCDLVPNGRTLLTWAWSWCGDFAVPEVMAAPEEETE